MRHVALGLTPILDLGRCRRPEEELDLLAPVFFDDPRGEPVQTEVLAAGESIDYGWCRAYPGPEGSTRSPPAAAGKPQED